jgi:hypothetical protein
MSDVIKFINGSTPNEGNAILRAAPKGCAVHGSGEATILDLGLTDNPAGMSGYLDTRFDEITYYTTGT